MRGLVAGREFVAELLGTCVLIMFGCGSVAQSVSTKYKLQNTNKIKTKYKLQRNTNTCVLIMFGCGSVAQSVGAKKY